MHHPMNRIWNEFWSNIVATTPDHPEGLARVAAVRYHADDEFAPEPSLPVLMVGVDEWEFVMPEELPESRDMTRPSADARSSVESRAERLARLQAEIAAGTYDDDEKFDIAVDRLLAALQIEGR